MENTNYDFTFWIMLVGIFTSAFIIHIQGNDIKDLTEQLDIKPTVVEVEKKVLMSDKYGDCSIKDSGDLLQPSGYWVNYSLNCWKLEQTLQEYCDNSKTDRPECLPVKNNEQ